MEPWNGEQHSLVDQWLAVLDDAHWNTRATAVRMLGELGELTPLEPLLAALNDEDESVRAAAVRALGKLGERAPVDRLVIALADPSWMVREMAALTLGELGERVPAEPLADVLHTAHEDIFVREAAQLALQQAYPAMLSSLAQDTAITYQTQDQSPSTISRHHSLHSSQAHLLGLAKRFFPLRTAVQETDDLVDMSDPGTAANSHFPLQPPVAASSRRSLPLRIAEGALVALVILGIGVSWLLLAQKIHPSPSGSTSHVGSTPTPIISSSPGNNNMSLTVVNNVVYAGASGGAVSAVRESDGGLLWQYSTDGSVETSPIVFNDVVYVTAYVSYGPSHVYALRARDGKLLWSYTRNSSLSGPLVVDGVAYLASDDGLLAALRASDGSVLWHREIKGQGVGIAEIVNGVIYGATYDNQGPGHVDAWRARDGSLLWQSAARLALLDVIDGVVYAGLDNDVEALQANTGVMLWRTRLDGAPFQMPIIVNNGVLYVTATTSISPGTATVPAHSGGYALETLTSATVKKTVPEKQVTSSVYALRATDGAVLWHHKGKETNGWLLGFIVSDGTIFGCSVVDTGVLPNGVHVTTGYVYALQSSTGVLLWSFIVPHNQAIAITVAHGVIYVGSDDAIYALRASTGSRLWRSPLDAAGFVNAPVVDGGSVYVGADNGITYALQAGTGMLRWYYLTKVSN
jgi:outer membrane protein assembly factor BamB